MSDPQDQVTVDIKVGGEIVDTATRRPVPEYDSEEWDAFIREIEGKIKAATGQ